VVDLESLASQQDIEGLAREAHVMAAYNHPHVLPLHCAFVHQQQLWLVMPYMEVSCTAGKGWPAAPAAIVTPLWPGASTMALFMPPCMYAAV
jgi:hypothetical protein